jgi:hypothetical protein
MKWFYRLLAIIILGAMAACSSGAQSAAEDTTANQAQISGTPGASARAFQPTPTDQLIIGTLLLEDTDQAITAEQASSLLPLWQLMQNLMTSDNTVQAEIDAVLKQINAAMTTEQLAWIQSQDLSNQNIFQIFQELGIAPSFSGDSTSGGQANGQGAGGGRPDFFPGGGDGPAIFPGGEGGPGGGQFAGGEGFTPEMQATRQAMIEANGGAFQRRSGSTMTGPLITWLEARAAEMPSS